MSKDRQQRANTKARKAKAKAAEAKRHRIWIDRPKYEPRRGAMPPSFGAGMVASAALMGMMAPPTRTDEQREAAERFLCRVFGEEYRP